MTRRLTAAVAAACALAVAAAGAAAAGNGNGQANGNSAQGAAAQAPQTPPGQAKQDAPAADQPAAPQTVQQTPPGQAKQATPAAQPAAAPAKTAKPARAAHRSSTAPGVEPGPTTRHWTHCTVGAGSSCSNGTPSSPPDASKRYGNGSTAAGIATSRGAPAGTVLTGPGNSQPHKVTVCGKPSNRSGGVDVHAVKSYDASACAPAPQTAAAASPAPAVAQAPAAAAAATPARAAAAAPAPAVPAPAAVASAAVTSAASPAVPAVATPAVPATPAAGGVLGAETTLHHPTQGVLGAVHTTRPGGSALPFTGLSLALFCLIAAALVATGVLLRRTARPDRP